MSELGRSELPEDEANPHWPDADWEASDRSCPDCGLLVWEAPWFDDPEEDGGSCIGTQYACGSCGWTDSH